MLELVEFRLGLTARWVPWLTKWTVTNWHGVSMLVQHSSIRLLELVWNACIVYWRTVMWWVEVFSLISKLRSWLHTITLLISAWRMKHVGISSGSCWWHERRTIHVWILCWGEILFRLMNHLLPIHSCIAVLRRFASLFRLASILSDLDLVCESNRSVRWNHLISLCRWFL